MFENQITVYRFMHGYGKKLLADISEAQFKSAPFTGGNPPSWIIGHLAIASDFILMILGQPMLLPKTWAVMFGPGSDPMKYLEKHPSRAELLAAYDAGYEAALVAMKHPDPSKLAGPSPFKPLIDQLPTAGDLLTHLLTSHEGFHVAQLSACRRGAGLPPLF
jgi:hypothetical protein